MRKKFVPARACKGDTAVTQRCRADVNNAMLALHKQTGWSLSVSFGIDFSTRVTIRMAHGVEYTAIYKFDHTSPEAAIERLTQFVLAKGKSMTIVVMDYGKALAIHARLQAEFPDAYLTKDKRSVTMSFSPIALRCLSVRVDDGIVTSQFSVENISIEEICATLHFVKPHSTASFAIL